MKRALIINEGLSSNLGDQAIRQALEEALTDKGFAVDFSYFSNPYIHTQVTYDYSQKQPEEPGNVKRSPKLIKMLRSLYNALRWYQRNRKPVKQAMNKQSYDLIIIGGGQLMNSAPGLPFNIFALALYVWTTRARKSGNKNIFLLGVGVSDTFHFWERFFYGRALQKMKKVLVRDKFSAASIHSNFGIEAAVYPDIAFYTGRNRKVPEKKKWLALGIYNYFEYVTKFENEQISKEEYYKIWQEMTDSYLRQGYGIKLFYTTVADAAETHSFFGFLQAAGTGNIEVADTSTLEKLNHFLGHCEMVVSGRMHALILALNHNCQVQPFYVNKKLEVFASEYLQSHRRPADLSREAEASLDALLS